MTMKEALAALASDEGVYSLTLTGEQARVTLQALRTASDGDEAAKQAADRLERLLDDS